MPRRKQGTHRQKCGSGTVRLNLGPHSPHLPLLDLISRMPAANLVPRRSGSGRTRSAARSAKHFPDPISIGATAIRNWRSPVLASLSTFKADLLIPAHDHTPYEAGFVDVHRGIDKRPEQYTWWSNRGQAWAKNVGWRIDYHVATPGIATKAKAVAIYKDERFSDHAPLIIDYHAD